MGLASVQNHRRHCRTQTPRQGLSEESAARPGQGGCAFGAHLDVCPEELGLKPPKRFLSQLRAFQGLSDCVPSKPNARQRWEAWVNRGGGWVSEGGEGKVIAAAAHSSGFVPDRFPQIRRSALKHRCVRERVSEGESHMCDCLFGVYRNSYGLGPGP